MSLLITKYLQQHTLNQLKEEHGVKAHWDSKKTKFSLNYDQILTKNGDKLAEECRGLILRPTSGYYSDDVIVGECQILAYPMNRFYNYGDTNCAQVCLRTARVYEKLDGTCTILYWDKLFSKWCVGTRSVPEADVKISDGDIEKNMTFYDLFMQGLDNILTSQNKTRKDFFDSLCKSYTYVFELTSPVNRIVVDYKETKITLIAIRDNSTLEELNVMGMWQIDPMIPRPTTYDLFSFEAIKAYADVQNPVVLEGFVLCDDMFNRCKIKNTNYVLAHKTKFTVSASKRNILVAILNGTIDDIIPMLTLETQEKVKIMQNKVRHFIIDSQQQYDMWKINANNDQKAFATFVTNSSTPISNIFFGIWHLKYDSVRFGIEFLIKNHKFTDTMCDKIISYLSI
jgi:T4 RnlA family RNA ligase